MPYLKSKNKRMHLDAIVDRFMGYFAYEFTGTLNYFLFKLAKRSCSCYKEYAAFIGELEAAKLEIYRRQIAPYEDIKIEENGDVK